MLRLGSCIALVLALTSHARAESACTDNAAWVMPGSTVPPHGRVVYYSDSGYGDASDLKLVATIDKKPVKTNITHVDSTPYRMTIVEIDSDKTGALSIGFGNEYSTATYKIAKLDMPKDLKGTTNRYYRAYRHTSVHEVYDGLSVALPLGTPAITAHVKIRRDSKTDWAELDVPVRTDDANLAPSVWLGALGCVSNYSTPLLEHGVDIEVVVTLADGTTRKVSLPGHVVLGPLPPDAKKSHQ